MNLRNPEPPGPHSEEHMLGHGFYNKHSHTQGKANTYGLPLIVEAINQIALDQVGNAPVAFIRRETRYMSLLNSAPVAQPDRATDF